MAYESVSSDTYGAKTSTVVNAPSGVASGDVLLGAVFVYSSTDPEEPTAPSGWALAPGTWPIQITISGQPAECYVYWKAAGGSEPGSYTWAHAGTRSTHGVIGRFSGRDTSTPFDVTPSQNNGTGTTTTFTGITTVTDGCDIVAIDWDGADNTTDQAAPSGSTPTFTDRLDATLTALATGVLATAGATGSKTRTNNNNGAGGPWASTLIALRPAEEITDPPVNTVAPAVTGTAQVGETLSCSTGTWDNSPSGYTYQWQRRA